MLSELGVRVKSIWDAHRGTESAMRLVTHGAAYSEAHSVTCQSTREVTHLEADSATYSAVCSEMDWAEVSATRSVVRLADWVF